LIKKKKSQKSTLQNWEVEKLKIKLFQKREIYTNLIYFLLLTSIYTIINHLWYFNQLDAVEIFIVGVIFIFTRLIFIQIRSWIDIAQKTKNSLSFSISQIIDFKIFKLLFLTPFRLFILPNKIAYYLDVEKYNQIIINYSFTGKIIDFFIFNPQEKTLIENQKIDYSQQKLNKDFLLEKGYLIIPDVYSKNELVSILNAINSSEPFIEPSIKTSRLILFKSYFKKNKDIKDLILTKNLSAIITQLFGDDFFVINSMYFDKPKKSPWGVEYHQDRQIIVKEKIEVPGFNEWFDRFNLTTVRATNEVLKEIFTIRIHIDSTTDKNGSLQVIEGSHKQGIFDPKQIDKTKEINCNVEQGGIMIMSPLLMHQSLGSENSELKRRVIHFDITNIDLPGGLIWGEKELLFNS
jgi:hypothetical protein